MEDKRISIRFRCDHELDMAAWNRLEELAVNKNTSKNSIIIDCLLQYVGNAPSQSIKNTEELADKIADKIMSRLEHLPFAKGANKATPSGENHSMNETEAKQEEDEPVLLSEASLDFLNAF